MYRKILTTAAALLIAATSFAQSVSSWKETCDSMSVRMKERSGVTVNLRLKSALKRGNQVDLYFTETLKDYPWRKGDVEWFRKTIKKFTPKGYEGLTINDIYAKAQLIEQLVDDPMGNNGRPVSDKFRAEDHRNEVRPLVSRVGVPEFSKGLAGRHIALWQSHGYYYNYKYDRWMWQRAPLFTTVEDVYTLTYVLPFLTPMLENAGANVLLPRDRDVSTVEVVAHPTANTWTLDIPKRGNYAVYVDYKTTSTSSDKALYTVSHLGGDTEFLVNQQMGGGTLIFLGTMEFDKGTATVKLTNKGGSNTTVSAGRVKVGGGVGVSGMPRYTEGARYWMEYAGVDRTVWDQNDSKDDYRDDFMSRGAWVNWLSAGSANHPSKYIPPKDGKGNIPDPREGLKIPVDLAFGFHSDAGLTQNDSIIGTLSIYTRVCDGKHVFPDGEDRGINRQLADMVQSQIVSDIQASWNPEWTRRELWDRSYSESRTPQVPAMLLELLSHQNFGDMKYGLDPAFRFSVSRAAYKGILKFLSNRYGCSYVVQPLPVHNFAAILEGGSTVRLSWDPTEDTLEPTANADRYILYTRIDDGGFDNGVEVNSNSTEVSIEPGHVYSWKVVAVNDGGLSFPSEILSAGVPKNGNSGHSVLVVNNFTRIGGPVYVDTPTYAGFNTSIDGGVPYIQDIGFIGEQYEWRRDRVWKSDDNAGFGQSFLDQAGKPIAGNTFDYTAIHGKAILEAGHAFSSSSSEWFSNSDRKDIWAVDIYCGKQLTCKTGNGEAKYTVFTPEIQSRITDLTASGTHFLVSGANIGKDVSDPVWPVEVDSKFLRSSERFLANVLGYELLSSRASRSANVQAIRSRNTPEIAEEGIRDFHFNNVPSADRYYVEAADAIIPADSKGRSFLRYTDSGTSAGICYNPGKYKTVCLGFPIEVITDDDAIIEIIGSTLKYFEK